MKRSSLLLSALLLALVVAARAFLPDVTEDLRQMALSALALDGDALAAFAPRTAAPASGSPAPALTPTPAEPAPEAAAQNLRYFVEEAAPAGELGPPPDPEPPAAVAAFLEQQGPFLEDRGLPDNVDYDYTVLPFDYVLPVAGYTSSGFGYRLHPILEEVKFHYGTDVAAWTGEAVRAFADGTVTFSGLSDTYGNYITLDHGDGWTTLYAHCSKLYVTGGQTVKAGEKIALVGATGRVTGPHLHFELRHNGVYRNPEYYLNA